MPPEVEAFGANLEAPPGGTSVGDLDNPRNQLDRDALAFAERERENRKAAGEQLRARVLGKPAPGAAAADESPPASTGEQAAVADEPESEATDAMDRPEAGGEPAAAEVTLVALPDGTEVPLEELIERATKGGMRQSDYTQKTMELAERQRAQLAAEQKLVGQADQLEATARQLEAAMAAGALPPEEMRRLEDVDPGKAAIIKIRQIELRDQAREARARAAAARQSAIEAAIPREIDALMAKESAFRRKDGSFNEELYAQVGEHAVKNLGYTREEWAEAIRHPQVIAALHSLRQVTRTRKVAEVRQGLAAAPRVLRPGAGNPAGRDTEGGMKRAQEALSKSPNSNHAIAAAFMARRRQSVAAVRRTRLGGAPS